MFSKQDRVLVSFVWCCLGILFVPGTGQYDDSMQIGMHEGVTCVQGTRSCDDVSFVQVEIHSGMDVECCRPERLCTERIFGEFFRKCMASICLLKDEIHSMSHRRVALSIHYFYKGDHLTMLGLVFKQVVALNGPSHLCSAKFQVFDDYLIHFR